MDEKAFVNEEIKEDGYEEEKRSCRYCGREMNTDFDFCIYCGKSQNETVLPAVKPVLNKENDIPVVKVKKKKKKVNSVLLLAFSITFFVVALIFFFGGFISWMGTSSVTTDSIFGSMFGSVDVSSYIISFMNVVASFLASLIFMFAGFIMLTLRKR